MGELAALTSACLWAISSVIYGRIGQRIPPLELNILKGAIAIALLICTLLLQKATFTDVTPTTLGLLLLSGVLGIGIGDTAFFFALNYLGARRALLMETLSPPLAAILALIFLQEQLRFSAWCGILLTRRGLGYYRASPQSIRKLCSHTTWCWFWNFTPRSPLLVVLSFLG